MTAQYSEHFSVDRGPSRVTPWAVWDAPDHATASMSAEVLTRRCAQSVHEFEFSAGYSNIVLENTTFPRAPWSGCSSSTLAAILTAFPDSRRSRLRGRCTQVSCSRRTTWLSRKSTRLCYHAAQRLHSRNTYILTKRNESTTHFYHAPSPFRVC
jgi:hypothetical protein